MNTATSCDVTKAFPNRRSRIPTWSVYAPGLVGSGAVSCIVLPFTVSFARFGAAASSLRTGTSGRQRRRLERIVRLRRTSRSRSAPGNRHFFGAFRLQAASTVSPERTSLGFADALTLANGAAFAVGVVAAATAPPWRHTKRLIAYTLIHSPCQSPRASGSISHTRPRLRS